LTASIGLQIDTRVAKMRPNHHRPAVLNPANDKPGLCVCRNQRVSTRSHTRNTIGNHGFTWNFGSRRATIRRLLLNYSYFPLPHGIWNSWLNASPVLVSPNDQLAPATTLQERYPQIRLSTRLFHDLWTQATM
jgi:hypothetical protein